jgi:transposase
LLDERTVAVGSNELIGWAAGLDAKRLWAIEDCRLLTPWLERQLLGLSEELVRVSPKLTVPERRAGRVRGKSDPIDAFAVARAALREPDLPRPQPGERVHRESSCWLIIVMISSTSGDAHSRGCAGTCTSSTRP